MAFQPYLHNAWDSTYPIVQSHEELPSAYPSTSDFIGPQSYPIGYTAHVPDRPPPTEDELAMYGWNELQPALRVPRRSAAHFRARAPYPTPRGHRPTARDGRVVRANDPTRRRFAATLAWIRGNTVRHEAGEVMRRRQDRLDRDTVRYGVQEAQFRLRMRNIRDARNAPPAPVVRRTPRQAPGRGGRRSFIR